MERCLTSSFEDRESALIDNENRTTQNLCDAAKAVLRGKFVAIQSYLKKQEKHLIDNVTLHLKRLEKEQKQQQRNTQS